MVNVAPIFESRQIRRRVKVSCVALLNQHWNLASRQKNADRPFRLASNTSFLETLDKGFQTIVIKTLAKRDVEFYVKSRIYLIDLFLTQRNYLTPKSAILRIAVMEFRRLLKNRLTNVFASFRKFEEFWIALDFVDFPLGGVVFFNGGF